MDKDKIAAIKAGLRSIHRIENPRAVHKICDEALELIEMLEQQTAPMPKRRGRPPKVIPGVTLDQ
jgi:hypothetical protein